MPSRHTKETSGPGQGQGGGTTVATGCAGINQFTTSAYAADATNGILGPFNDGDHVTLTVSLHTATDSSVSIVTPPASLVNVPMTCTEAVPVWPPIVSFVALAGVLAIAVLMLRRRQVQFA